MTDGQIVGKFMPQNHPVSLQVTRRQRNHLSRGLVQVHQLRSSASFLLNRARNRVITSDARLPSRIVRRAVSRAPSTFGGSAASIRRQVLALVMMPDSGWLSSCAIDAVKCSEAHHPGHMCKFAIGLVTCLFRQPARRDILNRRDVLQLTILVPGRMSDCMQVLDRVVRHQQTVLPFKVVAAVSLPGRPFSRSN